jgi:hypothetical protein
MPKSVPRVKRKSSAQKKHQERAKQAFRLVSNGKAKTLKAAWRKINS